MKLEAEGPPDALTVSRVDALPVNVTCWLPVQYRLAPPVMYSPLSPTMVTNVVAPGAASATAGDRATIPQSTASATTTRLMMCMIPPRSASPCQLLATVCPAAAPRVTVFDAFRRPSDRGVTTGADPG